MTLPDETNPSRLKKRSVRPRPEGARPAADGHQPEPRHTSEHVELTDAPLYRAEPDKKLQHHTLLWIGIIWMSALATVCVLAIVIGSVPTALVAAIAILATAIPIIVRHVFPARRR